MRPLVCLIFVLAAFGCKKHGYDQSQMANLTAPEQKIVGKYKLETEFNSAESKELVDMLKALDVFEVGETTLECFPDKTYSMLVGKVEVKGQWKLEQQFVQLRIDKVGDMRPEQIAKIERKNMGISGWSMTPKQRDEFLQAYGNSMALERAENMAYMRVGVGGTLYAAGNPKASIFGSMVSFFKKLPQE